MNVMNLVFLRPAEVNIRLRVRAPRDEFERRRARLYILSPA